MDAKIRLTQYFDYNDIRCVWFSDQESGQAPSGQQNTQWLPKGTYYIIGKETISVSILDMVKDVQSIRLEDWSGRKVYYVPLDSIDPNILAKLP